MRMYLPLAAHRCDPRWRPKVSRGPLVDQPDEAMRKPLPLVHTARMLAPSKRGRSVRTTVSTSGSSGMATFPVSRRRKHGTESVCQAGELRHRELFGAPGSFDSRLHKRAASGLSAAQRLQRPPQHLPSSSKRLFDHLGEVRRIAHRGQRRQPRLRRQNVEGDRGTRMKGTWTDVKQDFALGLLLHHHRQAAVHLAARSRQHALGELFCTMRMARPITWPPAAASVMAKRSGRCDLVGQVPHHHK